MNPNLDMRSLHDILKMILIFVKNICVGDRDAVILIQPGKKVIQINPEVYNEIRIRSVKIVTWNNPEYDSPPNRNSVYAI